MDDIVTNILEFIPDANPGWIREQVQLQLASDPIPFHAQARIIDSAYTYGYVKVEQPPQPAPSQPALVVPKTAKRKAPDGPGPSAHKNKKQAIAPRFDYTKLERPGHLFPNRFYSHYSIIYLNNKFDTLPVQYIRSSFNNTGRLVPAYLTLSNEVSTGTMGCHVLRKRRCSAAHYGTSHNDSALFSVERKALDAFIASGHSSTELLRSASPPPGPPNAASRPSAIAGPSGLRDMPGAPLRVVPAGVAARLRPETHAQRLPHPYPQPHHRARPHPHAAAPEYPVRLPDRPVTPPRVAETTEMECGCCFGDTDITAMTQCAEGHLFCATCTKQLAETAVGGGSTIILCMDQSGCRAPFTDDQLRRVLSANTLDLLDRLRQAKDLEAAKIGGLEHCPFCDFACIIEGEGRTFLCQKAGCMVESCRKCRRKDHAPRSCEEMDRGEKDSKGEHEIAEAMTRALIRDCPACNTPFMKEAGCNKMTCPRCGTISCYICRKEISRISPYTHFDQQPGAYHKDRDEGRCRLWDIDRTGRAGGSPTRAHDEEVSRAEKEARARLAAAANEGIRLPAPQFHRV